MSVVAVRASEQGGGGQFTNDVSSEGGGGEVTQKMTVGSEFA